MSIKQKSPSLQIKYLLCDDLESNAKIPFIQLPQPTKQHKKSSFHQEHHYFNTFKIMKDDLHRLCALDLYQYQFCQRNTDLFKIKRRRATVSQTQALQRVFDKTAFPSTGLREHLARHLGMPPRTVQIWFQNKRQAARKVYK
ncbi:copper-binding transcription factor [Mucor velutinosus]|uniref:Copper-binding transcription factor n=1 Tax=Mucor velutinosus TaxID=708070 RepID=A0AAN7DIX0_9FUNG|nr:copper-binding transcription factor [Mucor velutinosus]